MYYRGFQLPSSGLSVSPDFRFWVNILGLALVVDTVGETRVGSAMAYVSSAMSVGLILGPLLGGIIYARRGYYPAFGLAFAFIGMDLVLRIILVEKKIAIKYTSASSTVLEEEATRTVKLQSQPSGFADSERSIPSAVAVESPIAGLMVSKIPPVIRILKYPRLLVALFLSLVQALILSAFDATLPLYLNALFGFTALQAGEPNDGRQINAQV